MPISRGFVELQPGTSLFENFEEFLHMHVDLRHSNIHCYFYSDLIEHQWALASHEE
jgi:hypothetical protein